VELINLRGSPTSYQLDNQCIGSSSEADSLAELAAPAPQASLAIYHVNRLPSNSSSASSSLWNFSMQQQGLAELLPSFSSPLEGRIFGLGLSGAAGLDGSGARLLQAGPSNLTSAQPAPAFLLLLSVRIEAGAGGQEEGWKAGLAAQLAGAVATAEAQRSAASAAWWGAFWERSWVSLPPANASEPSVLAAQYARTRFIQAAQSRGVDVPIKFNGMLFMNQAGSRGALDVDYRLWGPDHWWQNSRLPYNAQLAAGDYDTLRVVLDWILSFMPLALARTALLLPEEKGMFFTETVSVFGLYQGYEYSCSAADRPAGYPVWLEG
jgi:hypothetical protein